MMPADKQKSYNKRQQMRDCSGGCNEDDNRAAKQHSCRSRKFNAKHDQNSSSLEKHNLLESCAVVFITYRHRDS